MISNQIGLDISYQKESIQYGYGLYCGYVLPNKINPTANVGLGYLFPIGPNEYYAGAKIETPLFYKVYMEKAGNPYLFQRRSWIDVNVNANLGMTIFNKIKIDGQISYPFHIYSVGFGYKY